MIKIKNGTLYQWDLNRIVEIEDPQHLVTDVQIAKEGGEEALSVPIKKTGSKITCQIPNIFLQQTGKVEIFAITATEETRVSEYAEFCVMERPEPANYVYTESEVLTYRALEEKLNRIMAELNMTN